MQSVHKQDNCLICQSITKAQRVLTWPDRVSQSMSLPTISRPNTLAFLLLLTGSFACGLVCLPSGTMLCCHSSLVSVTLQTSSPLLGAISDAAAASLSSLV